MISESEILLIKKITKKFQPTLLGIFGSFARNENTINSDLDILFDTDHKINLLDIIGLEQEISEKLNIKVDLITLKSINEKLKPYIFKDLILL